MSGNVQWNGKFPIGPVRPEKWSSSKGGPPELFQLGRTVPLSFEPKFPEILVEWIAPIDDYLKKAHRLVNKERLDEEIDASLRAKKVAKQLAKDPSTRAEAQNHCFKVKKTSTPISHTTLVWRTNRTAGTWIHFADRLADTATKVRLAKKTNTTMFMLTTGVRFLDIMNYLGPGPSNKSGQRHTRVLLILRSWFPCGWFDSPEKLYYSTLPDYKDWCSHLKGEYVHNPTVNKRTFAD